MRLFISADLEGICGVAGGEQTDPAHKEYERARRLMVADVNAVIRGALKGGATEITVNDSHGPMRNLLIEDLDPSANLITGAPKPLSMMQGISAEYDAAFLVGYHAQAGTVHGVLDHTFSGRIHRVMVNDTPVGETGLNALLAGQFGVPIRLVTGDLAVTQEARDLLGGGVELAAVKEGLGRNAAKCLPLEQAYALLSGAAERALASRGSPFALPTPYTLTVDFGRSSYADMAELIPDCTRQSGRRITFVHESYIVIYKAFRAMVALAAGVD